MNVTLSVDEQLLARARKKANALGKSLNQMIRDYLQTLAGVDDPERSLDEFKRLSGKGNSRGWRFNRDEIHSRKDDARSVVSSTPTFFSTPTTKLRPQNRTVPLPWWRSIAAREQVWSRCKFCRNTTCAVTRKLRSGCGHCPSQG